MYTGIIRNWSFIQLSPGIFRVVGFIVTHSDPSQFPEEGEILTSKIKEVVRDGDNFTVTTRSGSTYNLIEPNSKWVEQLSNNTNTIGDFLAAHF